MYSTGKYSHQFVITLNGDGEGQRRLVCCSPRHRKELDTTEQLNNNFKWSIICKNIQSLCCIPETNTIVNQPYFNWKKKGKAEKCFLPGSRPHLPAQHSAGCTASLRVGALGCPSLLHPCSQLLLSLHLSPCFGIAPGMPASCNPHCPGHWEGSGFGMMSQKGAQPWRGSVNML